MKILDIISHWCFKLKLACISPNSVRRLPNLCSEKSFSSCSREKALRQCDNVGEIDPIFLFPVVNFINILQVVFSYKSVIVFPTFLYLKLEDLISFEDVFLVSEYWQKAACKVLIKLQPIL